MTITGARSKLIFGPVVSALFLISSAQADIHYVALSGGHVPPFTNWVTAATDIQSAVDEAVPGDTVLVSNGTYATGGRISNGLLTNRVAITKQIAVESVNGASVTVIGGFQVPGTTNGDNGVRCVYITNGASLNGFTLTGGATRTTGIEDQQGGGIWGHSKTGNLVNACVVEGNVAARYGGGAAHAGLLNCVIIRNHAGTEGGGAFDSALADSVVCDNTSLHGGGVSSCDVVQSHVANNAAVTNGGGAYAGILVESTLSGNTAEFGGGCSFLTRAYDCTFTNNTAQIGGAAYNSFLLRCLLVNNVASNQGGGAAAGALTNCVLSGNVGRLGGGANNSSLANCLLVGNTATGRGGGVYFGRLQNCTLIGNTALEAGGGAGAARLHNCIVYFNSAPTGTNYSNMASFTNCCTTPLPPGGTGNIDADPMFVNTSGGIYRLQTISPCINAGSNALAATSVDLAGNPRIVEGVVDMGAYEYQGAQVSDTDEDGMPDWWEMLYALDANASNASGANLDGDWMSDIEEYWADTTPTNGSSFFPLVMLSNAPPGTMTLAVDPTSTARVYDVRWNTNLMDAPQAWTLYGQGRTGTGVGVTFTVTNDAPSRHYRTGVRLP